MLEIQDLHLVLFSHNFMILLQTKKKLVNPNLHHMQKLSKRETRAFLTDGSCDKYTFCNVQHLANIGFARFLECKIHAFPQVFFAKIHKFCKV